MLKIHKYWYHLVKVACFWHFSQVYFSNSIFHWVIAVYHMIVLWRYTLFYCFGERQIRTSQTSSSIFKSCICWSHTSVNICFIINVKIVNLNLLIILYLIFLNIIIWQLDLWWTTNYFKPIFINLKMSFI